MAKSLYERFVLEEPEPLPQKPGRGGSSLRFLNGYGPYQYDEPEIKIPVFKTEPETPPPSQTPQVDLSPSYLEKPDYQSMVESPDYVDLLRRGVESGTYEMLALPGVFGQWLAHRLRLDTVAEAAGDWADYWMTKVDELRPKEFDLFNVMDNPEVLANAGWWVYNLAEMAPSMLLTMGAGGLMAKGGMKLAARTATKRLGILAKTGTKITEEMLTEGERAVLRAGKIGAWIGGGVTGGATEAQQTYREVLKNGGTEEEAARAAELMFLGVGALNAFGTEWILRKAGNSFIAKVGRVFGASVVEGLTEGLEEPWEVISKLGAAILTGKQLPDDIESMFYDSLKSALTVFPLAAVMGGGAEVVTSVSNAKLDRMAKEIEKNKKLATDYYIKKITKVPEEGIDKTSTSGKQRRLFREPPNLFDQPMTGQSDATESAVRDETPHGEKIIGRAEGGVIEDTKEISDAIPPEAAPPPTGQEQPPGPAGQPPGAAPGGAETTGAPLGFIPLPQFWDASPEEQAYAYKEAFDFISSQDPAIQGQLKSAYEDMLMEHWENVKAELTKIGTELGLDEKQTGDLIEQFSVEAQASFENQLTHRQILDQILSNPPFGEEGGEEGPPLGQGVVEPPPVKETGSIAEKAKERWRQKKALGGKVQSDNEKNIIKFADWVRKESPEGAGISEKELQETMAEFVQEMNDWLKKNPGKDWTDFLKAEEAANPDPTMPPVEGLIKKFLESEKAPGSTISQKPRPTYYIDSDGRYLYVAPAADKEGWAWYRTDDLEKKGKKMKPRNVKGDIKDGSYWSTYDLAKKALDEYVSEQPAITAPEGYGKLPAKEKEKVVIGPEQKIAAAGEARRRLAARQPYLAEHVLKWGGIKADLAGEELSEPLKGLRGNRKIKTMGLDLFKKNGHALDDLVKQAIDEGFMAPEAGRGSSELESDFIDMLLRDLEARKSFSEQSSKFQQKWNRLYKRMNNLPKDDTEGRKKIQSQLDYWQEKIREVGEQTGRVTRVEEMAERRVREAEAKEAQAGQEEEEREKQLKEAERILPKEVKDMAGEAAQDLLSIEILKEDSSVTETTDKFGEPLSIDVGWGGTGAVDEPASQLSGKVWVDDDTGYVIAYRPPYELLKSLKELVTWGDTNRKGQKPSAEQASNLMRIVKEAGDLKVFEDKAALWDNMMGKANVTVESNVTLAPIDVTTKEGQEAFRQMMRDFSSALEKSGKKGYTDEQIETALKYAQEGEERLRLIEEGRKEKGNLPMPPATEVTQEERRSLRESLTRDGSATWNKATVTIKRDEEGTYYVEYKYKIEEGISRRLFNNPETDENWTKDQRTEAIDYGMEILINGPPRMPPPKEENREVPERPPAKRSLVDDLEDRAMKELGIEKWARWTNYKKSDDARIKAKMIELAKSDPNFDTLYYEKDGEVYTKEGRERIAGPREQGEMGHPLLDLSDREALRALGYDDHQIDSWIEAETAAETKPGANLETKARIAARERWRAAVNAETEKRGIKKLMFGPEATSTPKWAKDMYETIYKEELDKRKGQIIKAETKAEKAKRLFREKPKPGLELTPTEPTPQEKMAEMQKKGIIKKGEKSKKRAKLPEEKRKAPTTGTQRGLLPEQEKPGQQRNLVEELEDQATADERKRAAQQEMEKAAKKAADDLSSILDELRMRVQSLPENIKIPPAILVSEMQKNEYFNAAKKGDVESAQKLVEALVMKEQIAYAKKFGKEAIYVPVIAAETEGNNKIPLAFAYHVAAQTGAKVTTDVIQSNRVGRKGKGIFQRMFRRPSFEGKVRKGGLYVLFDDALVTGGTLAELANHIVSNGGVVAGVMVLGKTPGAWYNISIDQNTYNAIREKFGHAIEEIFGINPSALTDSEARFILKTYRDADAIRKAATDAGHSLIRAVPLEALPTGPKDLGRALLGNTDPNIIELTRLASRFWEKIPHDFSVNWDPDDEFDPQNDSVIFGVNNRVGWNAEDGWFVVKMNSSKDFIDHFNEVVSQVQRFPSPRSYDLLPASTIDAKKYAKIKEVLDRLWTESENTGKAHGLTTDEILDAFIDTAQNVLGQDDRITPYFDKWADQKWAPPKEEPREKPKTHKGRTGVPSGAPLDPRGPATPGGIGTADPGGGRGGVRPGLRVANERDLPEPRDQIPAGQYSILGNEQRFGVNLILQAFDNGKQGFLLADGTGVGKTMQELVAAHLWAVKSGKPSLIVIPNLQILESRFKADAAKLGMSLDKIEFVTYSGLRTGKGGKANYGMVIFDEAHNLKNMEAEKTLAANDIVADHRVFATATPMDRPTGAAYFLSKITGVPENRLHHDLGFMVRMVWDNTKKVMRPVTELLPGMSWARIMENIVVARYKAIRAGTMIRREYPFFGSVKIQRMGFTPELERQQAAIQRFWDQKIMLAVKPSYKRNLKGQKTQELSRWADAVKVEWIGTQVLERLSQGFRVVIVGHGIEDTLIKGLDRNMSQFIGGMARFLKEHGINDWAKIYGPNQMKKLNEIKRFQADQVKIAIMTPESGGAGVDLDDVHGDKPRVVFYSSPSFAGDTFQQVVGRFSRRNTASPAEVIFTLWERSEGDERRSKVVRNKIETLRRIQEGDDIDEAIGFTDTEEQGDGTSPFTYDRPKPPGKENVRKGVQAYKEEIKAFPLPASVAPFEQMLLDRLEQGKSLAVNIRDQKIRDQFHNQLWLSYKAQRHGIPQTPVKSHVDMVVGGGDRGVAFVIDRPYGKLHFDSRDGELRILENNDPMTDALMFGALKTKKPKEGEVEAVATTDNFTNWITREKDVMNGSPAKALSNELLQNSKDAVRNPNVPNALITVRWNQKDHLIEIEDNGKGMTQDEVRENYFVLGSINKGAADSGAFGLAKSFIFTYPGEVSLETTKEGYTTVYPKIFPDDVLMQKPIKGITTKTGRPNGTRIRIKLEPDKQPWFSWWDWEKALGDYQKWTKVPGVRIRTETYLTEGSGLSGYCMVNRETNPPERGEFTTTVSDLAGNVKWVGKTSWTEYEKFLEQYPKDKYVVSYTYENEPVSTGWDAEKMWRDPIRADFLGNKVKVYFVEIPEIDVRQMRKDERGWWHPTVFVYNKGFYTQTDVYGFSNWNFRMAEKENFAIYIDFEETVRPDQAEIELKKALQTGDKEKIKEARKYLNEMNDAYPWIKNRTEFSNTAYRNLKNTIEDVTNNLKDDQIKKQTERFKRMVEESPSVGGIKVLIPFNDDAEKETAKNIIKDNQDFFAAWAEYVTLLDNMMAELRRDSPGLGLPERAVHLGMIPGAAGFVPSQKTIEQMKSKLYEFVAFNPFGIDEQTLEWYKLKTLDPRDAAHLLNRAAMIAHASVHEWAHVFADGHGHSNDDPFVIGLGAIYSQLTHIRVGVLEDKAYEILERFKDRIAGIEASIGSLGKKGTQLSNHLGTMVRPEWFSRQSEHVLSEDAASAGGDREERSYNRGDITSALLGRLGQPAYLSQMSQPQTGNAVAWDYEQNRTFAMKLHEMADTARVKSANDVNKLQKKVQALAGSKSKRNVAFFLAYDKRLKRSKDSDDLDRAMFLYRDSGNGHPDVFNRFRIQANMQLSDPKGYVQNLGLPLDSDYAKRIMSGEHKLYLKKILRILDIAERLNPQQKQFVEEMAELFRDAGAMANREGLLKSFVQNYVRRVYKVRKGIEMEPSGNGHAFKTKFGPAQPRTYHYVLDAILDGYELQTEGITNAYHIYMDELIRVIANKHFIKLGMTTQDSAGNQLFTYKRKDGYKKLDGFSVWVWAGDVWAEKDIPGVPNLHINEYGKRFFATEPQELPEMWKVGRKYFDDEATARQYAQDRGGRYPVEYVKAKDTSTFFERVDLYAPAQLADMINKMTATDTLFRAPGFNELLRFNAGIKAWVLMSSFFHHLAGARSWVFGVHHGWGTKALPWVAYKAGLDKIRDQEATLLLGVKNGLTLGEIADFSELQLRNSKGFAERIANHFGLETPTKVIEWFKFRRESWADSLFKKYFAGLKAEAFVIEYNHALQRATDEFRLGKRQAPPDPDRIAESVAKLINDDFGGLHLRRMGRNPTIQNLFRLTFLAPDWTESNFRYVLGSLGLEKYVNKMVGDLQPPPEYAHLARQFVTRVMLRIAIATIMAQLLLNWKDDTEDFIKEQMLSNRFNRFRWTEVDITKLYELLGMDPDQRMTFSIGGHFFDPLKVISPFKLMKGKGSPLWRVADSLFSGSDWAERPYTSVSELVKTGKTTKKSYHQPVEGEITRLPSILIDQITSMQPIQVGHFIKYLQGEEDALTALMTSAGAQVHKAWKPPIETPIRPKSGADPLMDMITALGEKLDPEGHKLLSMGPPARVLTLKGKQYELDRKNYDRYVDDTTAIVRRKLEGKDLSKFTDERKAKIIEKVVRDARKVIGGRIKRELLIEERKNQPTKPPLEFAL